MGRSAFVRSVSIWRSGEMADHIKDDGAALKGDAADGGEDIIKVLGEREREMDALLKEARRKAASIREAAHKDAAEIKRTGAAEADAEVERIKEEEDGRIKGELGTIGTVGAGDMDEVKGKAKERMDSAVSYIKDFVINGGGESGSDS